MPVVKQVISLSVKSLLDGLKDGNPDDTMQEFSDGIADIIRDAILSATITVPPGAAVQVVPLTGTGTTTTPTIATIL
jgi:hypothetical protein